MAKRSETWRVVCLRCFEEEDARWYRPGSDPIEIWLYVVTIPALCLGGFVYSGVRALLAHWTCRVCTYREVVPVASVRGRKLREGRDEGTSTA
jgi:hypothetical protein